MANIAQDVKDIIVDKLGVPAAEITENASFQNDLGADSLDVVELLMTIEEKYGITVPDDEVQNLRTIRLMSEYIENNAN